MRCAAVLFDLDHTLFDTDTSEDLAFAHTMSAFGLTVDEAVALRPTYDTINRALWAAVERHELSPVEVRTLRFRRFLDAAGLDVDAERMADVFVEGLAAFGELYAGAEEVVAALADRGPVGLVTNGLSEVQRPRVARLGLDVHLGAVAISAELGVSKPSPVIFEHVLRELGVDADDVLMVGDSLVADVGGAVASGLTACWYNPRRVPYPDGSTVRAHLEIGDLAALLDVCGARR